MSQAEPERGMEPRGRNAFRTRLGPDGVHLFERCSGLNLLFDEISVPERLWARAPRQLSIALTNSCDLDCRHCYAPKQRAQLPIERVVAWLRELDEFGCLGIGFGGGEPTLHRDFTALCQYASSTTGLAVTFTTHAHHLQGRLLADLKGNVHFIRVSMDGIGGTYELIRRRSFSSFRRRLADVRFIAPFGINYVVNEMTFPQLDDAVAIATEEGASEFLLLPQQVTPFARGVSSSTMAAVKAWVRSYRGTLRLAVSENAAAGMPTFQPLKREVGLRAYAHIDAKACLKLNSFCREGVTIGSEGLIGAVRTLMRHEERVR